MHMLRATLTLFSNAATQAAHGLLRTGLALMVLFVGVALMALAETLFFDAMGSRSLIAVFGRALLQAAVVSTWLPLLGLWVTARRAVLPRHVKAHVVALFMPVLTVLIYLFFAQMLLRWLPISYGWALLAVVALAVNPLPEVLYIEREQGPAAPQQAFTFMRQSWPEWMLLQVPWLLFMAVLTLGMRSDVSLQGLIVPWMESSALLHPLFQPAALVQTLSVPNMLVAALWLTGLHAWFLMRGAVYRALSTGNRRLRAWQSRM